MTERARKWTKLVSAAYLPVLGMLGAAFAVTPCSAQVAPTSGPPVRVVFHADSSALPANHEGLDTQRVARDIAGVLRDSFPFIGWTADSASTVNAADSFAVTIYAVRTEEMIHWRLENQDFEGGRLATEAAKLDELNGEYCERLWHGPANDPRIPDSSGQWEELIVAAFGARFALRRDLASPQQDTSRAGRRTARRALRAAQQSAYCWGDYHEQDLRSSAFHERFEAAVVSQVVLDKALVINRGLVVDTAVVHDSLVITTVPDVRFQMDAELFENLRFSPESEMGVGQNDYSVLSTVSFEGTKPRLPLEDDRYDFHLDGCTLTKWGSYPSVGRKLLQKRDVPSADTFRQLAANDSVYVRMVHFHGVDLGTYMRARQQCHNP